MFMNWINQLSEIEWLVLSTREMTLDMCHTLSQKQVLKNAEEFQMESWRLWQAMFNQEIIPQGLNASLISKIFSSIIEKYKGRFKKPWRISWTEAKLWRKKIHGGGALSPNKSQMAAKEVELLPTKQWGSLLGCLSQLLGVLGSHSWWVGLQRVMAGISVKCKA